MNMGTRVPSLEVTKTCVLSSWVEGSKSPLRTVLRKSVGGSGESRSILRGVQRCKEGDQRGQWSEKGELGEPGHVERSRLGTVDGELTTRDVLEKGEKCVARARAR